MNGLLAVNETLSLLIQYIVYGSIFVVGLIVLIFLRKREKRPNMVIAKGKTEQLLKELEKILKNREKEEYLFPVKYTQLKNRVGDLVVLTEKEVTEKRNIAYDEVLTGYKELQDRLANEENWSRKRFFEEAEYIYKRLKEIYTLLLHISQEK